MNKDSLEKEINIQLANLERLAGEMEELTNRFVESPDFVQRRAAGSILHDFYCGVEKIFEKIALHIDGELPSGDNWHSELLLQMARPFKEIRGPIIHEDLLQRLKECLRFRHLFRNIYGFQLKWDRFKDLAMSLSDVLNELKGHLRFI